MAYEKVQLVVAFMSGDIYMARVKADGTMDNNNRRLATDDVMRAAAEWFIKNEKTAAHFEGHGWLTWVPENDNLTIKDVKQHIDKLNDVEDN